MIDPLSALQVRSKPPQERKINYAENIFYGTTCFVVEVGPSYVRPTLSPHHLDVTNPQNIVKKIHLNGNCVVVIVLGAKWFPNLVEVSLTTNVEDLVDFWLVLAMPRLVVKLR